MSLKSLMWATEQHPRDDPPRVTHAGLRTLQALAWHEKNGTAWPSPSTIGDMLGLNAKVVKRHLEALESHGLIARGDQSLARYIPVNRRPIVWQLNYRQGSPASDPKDNPRGHSNGRSGGTHQSNAPITKPKTETPQEADMSQAQNDLGGLTSSETRFPRQCWRHQEVVNAGENFDPCPACARADREQEAKWGQDKGTGMSDEIRDYLVSAGVLKGIPS